MYTKTVMIIDDDEDDRLLFIEALLIAEPNSRILTAYNGVRALKMLREANIFLPDYIFLDLNMPKMNGWECLEQIRTIELLNDIPIIMFSTSKETDFENIMLSKNVYFFTKPLRFDILVNGIQCVLSHQWESIKEINKETYA